MPDQSNHCRLFVILASESSQAVIFRRGPRIWTEIILWDTKTDMFTEGQWFRGTLYPNRCDLSPDGSKMIYFAAKFSKGHRKTVRTDPEYPYTWTAVSRPPYLTTLATAKAHGTWDGGGYFGDNNTIYINQSRYAPDKNNVPAIEVEKINVAEGVAFNPIAPEGAFYSGEMLYDLLLERRGWHFIQGNRQPGIGLSDNHGLWRKDNANHAFSLFMWLIGGFGKNAIWKFSLTHNHRQTEFSIDSDEWADWDQRGRLVYTHKGKLFAGKIVKAKIEPIQLADFNPNRVRMIQSPAWAKTWDQF